jgi:hypothetical protein
VKAYLVLEPADVLSNAPRVIHQNVKNVSASIWTRCEDRLGLWTRRPGSWTRSLELRTRNLGLRTKNLQFHRVFNMFDDNGVDNSCVGRGQRCMGLDECPQWLLFFILSQILSFAFLIRLPHLRALSLGLDFMLVAGILQR